MVRLHGHRCRILGVLPTDTSPQSSAKGQLFVYGAAWHARAIPVQPESHSLRHLMPSSCIGLAAEEQAKMVLSILLAQEPSSSALIAHDSVQQASATKPRQGPRCSRDFLVICTYSLTIKLPL